MDDRMKRMSDYMTERIGKMDVKAEWAAFTAREAARKEAEEAAARAAGIEPNSYDACAFTYKEYDVMPLLCREAAELRPGLDKLSRAEGGQLISRTLDEVRSCLGGLADIDDLAGGLEDLHHFYDQLEQALYVAEEPEEFTGIAKWMAAVYNWLPDYADYAIGRVGITAFCLEHYFEGSFDESAAHAAEAVEVAETLRKWVFVLLGRIDTVQTDMQPSAYAQLADYYERLSIDLGKQSQHFGQYVRGEEPQGVMTPDLAKTRLEKLKEIPLLAQEIEQGKYDAWELECMACAASELYRRRTGSDEKTDAAEMILLTDRVYRHYVDRWAEDYASLLQDRGAVDREGKASGIYIGHLGALVRRVTQAAGEKIEIPRKRDFYRLLLSMAVCLGMIAFVWLADPYTVGWLKDGSFKLLGAILAAAAVSAMCYSLFSVPVFVGIAGAGFLASLFILSLCGLRGGVILHQWVVTLSMGMCIYFEAASLVTCSPRAIAKAEKEKAEQEELLNMGIRQATPCAEMLAKNVQYMQPAGIETYYKGMLVALKKAADRLHGEYGA